jgi:ADP-heptose:LPS heptosyltransferase
LLAELNLSPEQMLIGLHPGSAPGFTWKRWPLESFARLAAALAGEYNAHFLIFGGPDEAQLKQGLKSLIPNHQTRITIIDTDLLTTAAVMQRCRLVVANDSGLMHLASAAGSLTLGIFGPTDEDRIGPRGPRSFAIRAPGTKPVYDVNTNYDLGEQPHPSLLALPPEAVLAKIKTILAPSRSTPHDRTPRAAGQ